MKKILLVCITLLALGGCASENTDKKPDVTVVELEKRLNDGEVMKGKTVEITVDDYEPTSAFGYNIMTGEHLNFVSSTNPEVKLNDKLIVEIDEVEVVLGSFIITYKK